MYYVCLFVALNLASFVTLLGFGSILSVARPTQGKTNRGIFQDLPPLWIPTELGTDFGHYQGVYTILFHFFTCVSPSDFPEGR